MEFMTMPPAWFNMLYMIAVEKRESGEAEKQAKADVLEEIATEGGLA